MSTRLISRCCGMFRPSWDVVDRCGLPERHKGGHGPAPASAKPALAQEHSETSKEAARQIEPVRGTLRARVLDAIREGGGYTDEEGMGILEMPASTYRPRRVELVEAGLVRDSGQTRDTKSGRKAVVWVTR